MARRPEYQSITLSRAIAKGWAYKQGLNTADVTVLQFVASWGSIDQPGAAFTWFPQVSMEGWAEDLGMSRSTLFRSIKRLAKVGHLEARTGVGRWVGKSGFGIPVETMYGCDEWARRPISQASKEAQRNDLQDVDESVNLDTPTVSTLTLHSVNLDTHPLPLTRGNAAHNQGNHQREERNHPLTRVPAAPELTLQAGEGPSQRGLTPVVDVVQSHSPIGDQMTQRDIFYANTDSDESEPSYKRDKPKRPKRPPAISTQLAEYFYDGWAKARESDLHRNLNLPYSNKTGFQTNINRYLEVDDADTIRATMDAFWKLVAASQVRVSGGELWIDFHNARAQARALSLSQAESTGPVDTEDIDASNAEKLAELDRLRGIA